MPPDGLDRAGFCLLDALLAADAAAREVHVSAALAQFPHLREAAQAWVAAKPEEALSAVAERLADFIFWLAADESAASTLGNVWPARLAAVANLTAALQNQERQVGDDLAAAKVEALKEFAYGAGHEINNPLANISARAQTLLRDEPHPERRRTLATINRQAFRAHEMITDLMLFARPPELRPQPLDAVVTVRRVVEELSADAKAQATLLSFHAPHEPLPLVADEIQLAVAVKAVVRNSLEALAAGGQVNVYVRPAEAPVTRDAAHNADFLRTLGSGGLADDHRVEIAVSDDGPGLSEREQAHLFDPFFSGREAGRGLGFGLCKAWRIITDHGGQIAIASQAGRGTTVTIAI